MEEKVPANKVSFNYSFKVNRKDLDTLNHVNNIVYLQWVQDISEKHWYKLASGKLQKEYIWMALRHEIDYLNQAFLDDTITIYTWIEDTVGAKSIRIVHVYKGDTVLVKCKTTWVLLDANTLKPKRIHKEIFELFTPDN